MFSIERVVVLLTPLFGAAATWIVTTVATNVPGAPHLDGASVEGIEIAVFVATCGLVAKWLHGRQKPELISPPFEALHVLRRPATPPEVSSGAKQ